MIGNNLVNLIVNTLDWKSTWSIFREFVIAIKNVGKHYCRAANQ